MVSRVERNKKVLKWQQGWRSDQRVFGARSLGRVSTKVTIPVSTKTRATTLVMAAV